MAILSNHTYFTDAAGYVSIYGEVQNNLTQHLHLLKITANFFNAAGHLLATEYTFSNLRVLPTGDRTCFSVSTGSPVEGWATYQFETPTYYTGAQTVKNLVIFNDSGTYNTTLGWYEIIGQVRNDNPTRIQYVRVVSTLYNGTGGVIGCSSGFVNSTSLDPGQISSFKIINLGRDYRDIETYRLQVEGSP